MIERAFALSAAVLLPLLLRALPLRALLALCDRWPSHDAPIHAPHALARRVHRWLRRGRGPWRNTCLTRAVVLYAMLRQHGYRPRLHIGVAGGASSFLAHAWVSINGTPVRESPAPLVQYRELVVHGA